MMERPFRTKFLSRSCADYDASDSPCSLAAVAAAGSATGV